jgi:hypothetical protein
MCAMRCSALQGKMKKRQNVKTTFMSSKLTLSGNEMAGDMVSAPDRKKPCSKKSDRV